MKVLLQTHIDSELIVKLKKFAARKNQSIARTVSDAILYLVDSKIDRQIDRGMPESAPATPKPAKPPEPVKTVPLSTKPPEPVETPLKSHWSAKKPNLIKSSNDVASALNSLKR